MKIANSNNKLSHASTISSSLTAALLGWYLVMFHCSVVAADKTEPNTAQIVASTERGWPQFRGPKRNSMCDEKGLLQSWPQDGPRKLWTARELGQGYSAPIFADGRIFLTGDVGEDLVIFALDEQGNKLWQTKNGKSWKNPYPGARASCTYRYGQIYHMNAHGRVACLDAKTGREIWAIDILETFGGKNITWALSDCLLVEYDRVFVTPGGSKALMAALDAFTGKTIWTTEPLKFGAPSSSAHERVAEPAGGSDNASNSSPILFTLNGRKHLVNCSQKHVFGVDTDNGKLLWSRPLVTRYLVIAGMPVLIGNGVFVTAPDTEHGKYLQIIDKGDVIQIKEAWNSQIDTCHGGLVLVGNHLYGSWYRKNRGWASVDSTSGKIIHQTKELAMGSVLYADNRLYILDQEGQAALINPEVGKFDIAGRFRLVKTRVQDAWTHPVIFNKKLYLRYQDELYCYDIAAPPLDK